MIAIGFDTSNYTTSVAYFDGQKGINCSKLLPVKEGELGLRQSDAVFHHTHSLPELSGRLFSQLEGDILAVGVSTRPRVVEGSYMPCFTVGYSNAALLSNALHIPLFEVSHQQGHIAAVLFGAGREDLLDIPHLAWHLSGGTTELLLVTPGGKNVHCEKIGGTTDISAGQLIDRTGQMLNLPFPSGKHLDALSKGIYDTECFRPKCADMHFSLSGVQNKVSEYADCHSKEEVASYALRSVFHAVIAATRQAKEKFPDLPVVFSGGVSSNSLLRELAKPYNAVFSPPEYATDNAMGVALLAYRLGAE